MLHTFSTRLDWELWLERACRSNYSYPRPSAATTAALGTSGLEALLYFYHSCEMFFLSFDRSNPALPDGWQNVRAAGFLAADFGVKYFNFHFDFVEG